MIQSEWCDIGPRGDATADADRRWRNAFHDEQICRECGSRLSRFWGCPVDVVLMGRPDNAPIMPISGASATLIRTDLLGVLDPHMQGFLIGTVRGPEGQPYDDFRTCTAAHVLPLRGTVASTIGTCTSCGMLRYYPTPYEKEYIVEDSLVPSKLVYQPSLGLLLVHEDVLAKVPEALRRKLRVKRIPVRPDALDGIEDFPALPP